MHARAPQIIRTTVAVVVALVAAAAASGRSGPPWASPSPRALSGFAAGASSTDALVRSLVDAVSARDSLALRHLRVTETEYLEVVVPGSAEPGAPPQRLPAQKAQWFWQLLDTKSAYSEQRLLAELGGHAYRIKGIEFAGGTKHYAGYVARSQLRVLLEDERGDEHELRTGSIAEVDGKFKFVSFVRD